MEALLLHETAGGVPHKRQAPRHARAEVGSGRAENEDRATRHVLAGVIANTFDDRSRTGVANGEALASAADRKQRATRSAVERNVADDHLRRFGACQLPRVRMTISPPES